MPRVIDCGLLIPSHALDTREENGDYDGRVDLFGIVCFERYYVPDSAVIMPHCVSIIVRRPNLLHPFIELFVQSADGDHSMPCGRFLMSELSNEMGPE